VQLNKSGVKFQWLPSAMFVAKDQDLVTKFHIPTLKLKDVSIQTFKELKQSLKELQNTLMFALLACVQAKFLAN
jgi:hypothetical protein